MVTDAQEITLETRVVRKEVFASTVGDELILFDEEAGAYFATGPVGARIWQLMAKEREIIEICRLLEKEFDVSRAACESQTFSFINDLISAKLATLS